MRSGDELFPITGVRSVSLVKYQMQLQHSNKSCNVITLHCIWNYVLTDWHPESHNTILVKLLFFMIRKIIISRNVHTNRSISVSLTTSSQHNDRTHYTDLSQMMMIIVTMKWSGNLRKLFVTGDPGDPRDPVHGPPCPQSLGDIIKVCVQKIRQEIKIQLTKSGL